jgi:Uma2 family endonuclease
VSIAYRAGKRPVVKKARKSMTTAEYLQTPETVLPRELAYGALRVADSPSASHQRVVREMALALTPFVRDRHMGEVLFAPMDVVLDYDADLVVQPDILFVSGERSHLVQDRVYGAPDLVVEVLSPHPRIGKLEERIGWFARHGVRECWLASLPDKQIVVLALADGVVAKRTLFAGATRIESEVLGSLDLRPLDVFGY